MKYFKDLRVDFCKFAGLVTIWNDNGESAGWCLHLGVYPWAWVWFYRKTWYDGPIYEFGLGPLFHLNYNSW